MPKDQLSQEDVEIVKQAKAAKEKMENMGIDPNDPNAKIPNPEASEKPAAEVVPEEEYFVEIRNLPSRGFVYKNPMMGQALKVNDLLLIQGIDDININNRFSEIFNRRIRGVSADEMLVADEAYTSLWLRASSFPGYLFPHEGYTCKKCKLEIDKEHARFGFESLKFKTNIDKIMKLYGEKDYVEVTLPTNKLKFKIELMKRKHLARVDEVLRRKYYQFNKEPPEDVEDLLEVLSVIDFTTNDGPSDLGQVLESIQSPNAKLDAVDFIELIQEVNKHTLTCETIVNLKCPNETCQEVTPLEGYPFRPEIYFPVDNV